MIKYIIENGKLKEMGEVEIVSAEAQKKQVSHDTVVIGCGINTVEFSGWDPVTRTYQSCKKVSPSQLAG